MKKRFLFSFLAVVFIISFASAQIEKVTNGSLEDGTINGWIFEGDGVATATMEASNVNPITGTYSLHVTITKAGTANWHIQVVNLFGVRVKNYAISYKARANAAVTWSTQMQQDHSPYGTIIASDDNITTTAQTFTHSVNNYEIGQDSSAKLNFCIGLLPTGTEIWFDDVSVIETKAPDDKVVNGDLESGTADSWAFQTGGSGAATMEASAVNPLNGAYSLHVTVTTQGTANWHIQVCNLFGVNAVKKYTISYTARASADVVWSTQMQQNHDPYGTLIAHDDSILTTPKRFTYSVNNYEIGTDADAKLNFCIGLLPTGTEIWFDDITVIETNAPPLAAGLKTPGTEKINNGFFEDAGAAPWSVALNAGGGVGAATVSLDKTTPIDGTQSAHIQVTDGGTADWHVQLMQPLSVLNGKRYFTMFKARASKDNVVIKAGIQQYHGNYSFLSPFKAETLMTAVKTILDTTDYMTADDASCIYTIYVGNNGPVDVWVDAVTMIENTMAAPLGIVIDGEKDVFYNTLTNPDDGKIFLPARAVISDIGTAATWPSSNAINSATIWTAWDRDYLYYYVEVNDDIVLDNNTTNWSNDKIEVKLNPDPTITSTGGALQVGISALGIDDAQVPEAVDNLDVDKNLCLPGGAVWASTPNDYARRTTNDGYVLEWRLPINAINNSSGGQKLYAGVGGKFGEIIQVADNDDTQRRSMISWSSGMKDAGWSNPQMHGAVTFLANNKLKYVATSLQDPATYHNDSASVWYFGDLGPQTGVNLSNSNLPGTFALEQNYPNPFNPTTTIEFSLPSKSNVRLVLINMLGQEVKEISSGSYGAGNYKVAFDASSLASGVYFYKIQAGSYSNVKKLVLVK